MYISTRIKQNKTRWFYRCEPPNPTNTGYFKDLKIKEDGGLRVTNKDGIVTQLVELPGMHNGLSSIPRGA